MALSASRAAVPAPAAAAWQPSPGARIPALDGVRGLAILLVILFHHTLMRPETTFDRVYVNVVRLGWSGVDLFFVLSGFLITGLLLDFKGGAHYFRNFYARRTLRIFPLYYAFLFFTLRVAPWMWPGTPLDAMARDAMAHTSEAWYWLYGSNVLFARDENFGHPNLAVTWSLAIEEQFYIVWPAIVALMGRRALAWTCGALIVAAFGLRVWLVQGGAHWIVPHVLPVSRMDALAAGALVAIAVRSLAPGLVRSHARWIGAAATSAVVAIWLYEDPLDDGGSGEPLMQTAGYTALAAGYAALVALTAASPADARVARVFSTASLRALGRYSYALYLFHVPIRRFIRDEYFPVASFPTLFGSPLPGQLLFYVVATAPALALAWLSWHLFEKRVLAVNRFFPYRRQDT